MTQIIPYSSVRFFPYWQPNDHSLVIGLIEMVNYILDINPNASHWLELGSHIGESSTIFLGFSKIERLECVEKDKELCDFLTSKYADYIKSHRCNIHYGNSKDLSINFLNDSFDVVYIDADHSYEAVRQDIELYLPKIRPGGFLAGHDYIKDSKTWQGVYQAVNEFADKHQISDVKTFKDSSWVIRKSYESKR